MAQSPSARYARARQRSGAQNMPWYPPSEKLPLTNDFLFPSPKEAMIQGALAEPIPPPPRPHARRLTEPIFRKVYRAMGLPGKPPQVLGTREFGNSGILGMTDLDTNQVRIPYKTAQQLRMLWRGGGRNLDALATLMHEYVHTAQPRVLNRDFLEGAAETYTQDRVFPTMQRMGLPDPSFPDAPVTHAYASLTAKVRRNMFNRWLVNQAQFGRGR